MAIRELVASVKDLYGGFEAPDLESAKEDGTITAEEYSALAGVLREENYRKLLAGCNDRWRKSAAHKAEQRRKAIQQDVPAGMILRGNRWVKLAI